MGLKFSDYEIKGIDVSQWQGSIEWDKTMLMHPDFAAIKAGAGRTTDPKFTTNWAAAKGKVFALIYWYLDYYSNYNPSSSAYKMTDEAWGKAQADYCWSKIKSDPAYVFLDVENATSSTAAPITNYTTRGNAIAKAFLERMDILNGKTNGIYCSLGLLTWFSSWFKNRPLWVAWYNEIMTAGGLLVVRTLESVKAAVKAKGWLGKILIWQYTSDGDIDDNGYGDGVLYGMDSNALDLNIWLESKEEFAALKGGTVTLPEPPIEPTPDVMNIQLLSQQDIARKTITFGNTNIGVNGCVTVNIEMLLNYLGLSINTTALVTWLKANGGYSGNLFVWASIEKLLPGLKFIAKYTGPRLDMIDESLSRKVPCLVHVDFDPATYLVEQHWVLVIGKQGTSYIINDPRDGSRVKFEDVYGDPSKKIFNVSTYSYISVPPPTPEPVPLTPKTKVVHLGKTLVDYQNLRRLPNLSATVTTKIMSGKEVEILAFAKDISGNSWVRLGPDLWAAQQIGATKFVEQVYV